VTSIFAELSGPARAGKSLSVTTMSQLHPNSSQAARSALEIPLRPASGVMHGLSLELIGQFL
jgi:hypothetical protein